MEKEELEAVALEFYNNIEDDDFDFSYGYTEPYFNYNDIFTIYELIKNGFNDLEGNCDIADAVIMFFSDYSCLVDNECVYAVNDYIDDIKEWINNEFARNLSANFLYDIAEYLISEKDYEEIGIDLLFSIKYSSYSNSTQAFSMYCDDNGEAWNKASAIQLLAQMNIESCCEKYCDVESSISDLFEYISEEGYSSQVPVIGYYGFLRYLENSFEYLFNKKEFNRLITLSSYIDDAKENVEEYEIEEYEYENGDLLQKYLNMINDYYKENNLDITKETWYSKFNNLYV